VADPTGGERLVGWSQSAYTWLLVRPVSPGFWLAALVFLVLATVANVADGDWLSVALGSLLAAVVGSRLWDLRGAAGNGPASGQDRTASR
jgi:hypothetical protein